MSGLVSYLAMIIRHSHGLQPFYYYTFLWMKMFGTSMENVSDFWLKMENSLTLVQFIAMGKF